ncbi:group II intron reverse transcriptase/maturase [Paraburkholderia sediminicola]|uniref:group II intron reverse transcriptase/maturase n=1 Tax=Paraburkholderia sediminicola TaxID=458836 RepID=UPI0038B6C35C
MLRATRKGRTCVDKAKPFSISKREVWDAYKQVKANRGAAGVDEQSMQEFEADLKNNLYRIWNRMSSGSYMPPPVLRVDIPKAGGAGTRPLGIPTISVRIAQTVVKRYLEPLVEPVFHDDSYGYRPGRSAHRALDVARQRCWNYAWALYLDIKNFFGSIDWELMMRAVRRYTDCAWVLLYVERWLKAPVQMPDGTVMQPDKGTPQGGVVSPVLANLFLHYVLDRWMQKHHPDVPFERYADDAVYHCQSEAQARLLRQELEARLAECKLALHPDKTKIVYC